MRLQSACPTLLSSLWIWAGCWLPALHLFLLTTEGPKYRLKCIVKEQSISRIHQLNSPGHSASGLSAVRATSLESLSLDSPAWRGKWGTGRCEPELQTAALLGLASSITMPTSWAQRSGHFCAIVLYPLAYQLCLHTGFPGDSSCRRHRFHPWVKKMPWRRARQPTPLFLPRKSHGQRSRVGYSSRGRKEPDSTEHAHTFNYTRPQCLVSWHELKLLEGSEKQGGLNIGMKVRGAGLKCVPFRPLSRDLGFRSCKQGQTRAPALSSQDSGVRSNKMRCGKVLCKPLWRRGLSLVLWALLAPGHATPFWNSWRQIRPKSWAFLTFHNESLPSCLSLSNLVSFIMVPALNHLMNNSIRNYLFKCKHHFIHNYWVHNYWVQIIFGDTTHFETLSFWWNYSMHTQFSPLVYNYLLKILAGIFWKLWFIREFLFFFFLNFNFLFPRESLKINRQIEVWRDRTEE